MIILLVNQQLKYFVPSAFADSIRNQMQVIPILILAVTDSGGFFTDEFSQSLITDGNLLADNLGGEFKMTTANFQQQSKTY